MSTYIVGGEGQYQTIGAAIAAAGAGDVVQVLDDKIYREAVTLDKPGVVVEAMQGCRPTIDGGYHPGLFGAAGYTTATGAALKPNQLPYPSEANARRGGWPVARDQSAIVRLMAEETVFRGLIIRNVCGRGYRVFGRGAKLMECVVDFTYSGSGICDGDDNVVSDCIITRGSMKYFDPTVANGKGTQTCVMTKGRNARILRNIIAFHFGEGGGADKGSKGTVFEENILHTCLHWLSGENEADDAVWVRNVFLWCRNLAEMMRKDEDAASDAWVAGNEQEDGVLSLGPLFMSNIIIGCKEGIAVSNGLSGRPISFVSGRFRNNTVIGDEFTRYLMTWGTYAARPHQDTIVENNIFLKHPAAAADGGVKLHQAGGDVIWRNNVSNCALPPALRGEGDVLTDGPVLANPWAEIVGEFDVKSPELPNAQTTFNWDNYRPVAGSPALTAGNGGGLAGALGPADVEPPPPPPPPPPPDDEEVDWQALANLAAEAWGKVGQGEERLVTALDLINEGLTRTAAGRADLQRLIDLINAQQV